MTVLGCTIGSQLLVEVKTGETFNGILDKVDSWMNIKLTQVIRTSPNGDRFWRIDECYIKGSTIKYVRVGEEVLEKAKEENRRNTRPRVFREGGGSGRGRRGGGNASGHAARRPQEEPAKPQSGTKFAPSKSQAAVKIVKKQI